MEIINKTIYSSADIQRMFVTLKAFYREVAQADLVVHNQEQVRQGFLPTSAEEYHGLKDHPFPEKLLVSYCNISVGWNDKITYSSITGAYNGLPHLFIAKPDQLQISPLRMLAGCVEDNTTFLPQVVVECIVNTSNRLFNGWLKPEQRVIVAKSISISMLVGDKPTSAVRKAIHSRTQYVKAESSLATVTKRVNKLEAQLAKAIAKRDKAIIRFDAVKLKHGV